MPHSRKNKALKIDRKLYSWEPLNEIEEKDLKTTDLCWTRQYTMSLQ